MPYRSVDDRARAHREDGSSSQTKHGFQGAHGRLGATHPGGSPPERDVYGGSIDDISDALGVTKQTLLHHFGSKQKLHVEVLQQIADRSAGVELYSSASDHSAKRQARTEL